MAINDVTKPRPWGYVKGGTLSGAVNGYSLRIAAYYKSNDHIEKAHIICPYAIGFMEKRRRLLRGERS
jgi:hypothetical protein